jgi:hypothetical protein
MPRLPEPSLLDTHGSTLIKLSALILLFYGALARDWYMLAVGVALWMGEKH